MRKQQGFLAIILAVLIASSFCYVGADSPPEPGRVLSVVLVVDTSGSMSDSFAGQSKISSARAAAHDLLTTLEAENKLEGRCIQVSIVQFDTYATLVQPMTSDFDLLRQGIDSLRPDGWTNVGDGLATAYRQLASSQYDDAYIILLSDGITNQGRSAEEILNWLIPKGRQASFYGFDYGPDDLESVSDAIIGSRYLRQAAYQATAYYEHVGLTQALATLPDDAVFCFDGHSNWNVLGFRERDWRGELQWAPFTRVSLRSNNIDLAGMRLAALAGCLTAGKLNDENNIMRAFVEHGAEVAMGFYPSLFHRESQLFMESFWKAASEDGKSVAGAIHVALEVAPFRLRSRAETWWRYRVTTPHVYPGWESAERVILTEIKPLAPVYTVGFGRAGEQDEDLLQAIADATGGQYFYGAQAFQLANIFVTAQHLGTGAVAGEFEGDIRQGERVEAGEFTLDRGESELRVSLNWPGSHLDLQLIDPQGNNVGPDYPGATVWVTQRPAYVVVEKPRAGQWSIALYGADVPDEDSSYYVVASQNPHLPRRRRDELLLKLWKPDFSPK